MAQQSRRLATSKSASGLGAARIPAYAVLGNHDYGLDDPRTAPPKEVAGDLRQVLTFLGIKVLRNEAVKLLSPQPEAGQEPKPLYLAGIGSRDKGVSDPGKAIAAVPDGEPRIVMMHNPHSFESLPSGSAPLAVAGHTHGAQVRIPLLPGRSWLARYEGAAAHASGWTAAKFGERANRLYVNRGIGFSGLPLRLGARPEITLFTLLPA